MTSTRAPVGSTTHHSDINLKVTAVSEGVAGNFTVAGITVEDTLIFVGGVKMTLSAGTPNTVALAAVNVTTEFTITAADTINNTAGTDLSDTIIFCVWLDKDM